MVVSGGCKNVMSAYLYLSSSGILNATQFCSKSLGLSPNIRIVLEVQQISTNHL